MQGLSEHLPAEQREEQEQDQVRPGRFRAGRPGGPGAEHEPQQHQDPVADSE